MAITPRIPVLGIPLQAWQRIWRERRRIALTASGPFFGFLLLHAIFDAAYLMSGSTSVTRAYLWLGLSAIPKGLFALFCHQLVLLGQVPSRSAFPQGAAVVGFCLLWVAGALASPIVAMFIPSDAGLLVALGTLSAAVAVCYLAARFSLVLPALAQRGAFQLRGAWAASRGNGWRLVVVPVLSLVPLGLAVFGLRQALPQVETAQLESEPFWFAGAAAAGAFTAFLALAVGATSLSLAYQHLGDAEAQAA